METQRRNDFLLTNERKKCCGCTACVASCPTKCLDMVANEEGFYYPQIEEKECINCGLCAGVCPMMHCKTESELNMKAYAAHSTHKDCLESSSSGGIFPEIAKFFLHEGGKVYGATINEEHKVFHLRIENIEDLEKLLGSKYVQSTLKNIYEQCRNDLNNKYDVLFVGTPCQIYGLKKYLKREYENLYTLDLICHGVPSQLMFDRYIQFLEKKHSAKLVDINFRDKKRNGWSITLRYTMKYENGKIKNYNLLSPLSEYFSGFLGGIILRESCYDCRFATLEREGDITLGDFWGYQKTRPELRHDKGLSLLLVNSEKGERIVERLKKSQVIFSEVSEESILQSENRNLYYPTARPSARETVYQELEQKGFEYIAEKYFRNGHTMKNYVKNLIPASAIRFIKGKRLE